MHKLILASATLGILAVGAIANAQADGRDPAERRAFVRTQQESAANLRGEVWLGPGVTVPAEAVPVIQERHYYAVPGTVVEERSYYIAPAPVMEVPIPVMPEPYYAESRPIDGYSSSWYRPGDAAIIKQEIMDERGAGR